MASSVAGETFVSAFLPSLLDRLHESSWRYERDAEVQKLTESLYAISAFLDDAEEKQNRNRAVNKWLDDLKAVVYDADDLVDEIATYAAAAAKTKSEAQSLNLVTLPLQIITLPFRLIPLNQKPAFKSKITSLIKSMEELAREAASLGLEKMISRTRSARNESFENLRPETTSLVDESIVYGREEDKQAILKLLLTDDDDDGKISAISIVGMAGLGKTTLAQLAFNDDSSKTHFRPRVWVYVGVDLDICKVMKTILEAMTGKMSEINDASLLQTRLNTILKGKKFLLVLDDVWTESYNDWNILQNALAAGARGSKIIATTRNSGVANMLSTMPAYNLRLLNNEYCWSIISKLAIGNKIPISHPRIQATGKEIAKKCDGLPLAAKAIGNLLRYKSSITEWEAVLKSNLFDLEVGTSRILPAIKLSYYHLPSHLRHCFAYCSLFPKGYEFDKDKLVLLWMAEGFLRQSIIERREDVGDGYFRELLSRSFFQQSGADKSSFVMHELITELAQLVAGRWYFTLEDSKPYALSEEVRHVSYARGKSDSSEKFKFIFGARRLRTLLPSNSPSDHESCHLNNQVLHDLLERLPFLRVLSMAFYDITKMPDSIGKLKHLRYLDLSHTALTRLPESIASLYNLQTLDLSNCRSLTELPQGMWMLINLRHLLINGTDLQEMPLRMSRLTNLQRLSNFFVGKGGSRFNELSGLSDLHGALSISKLQNLDPGTDALNSALKEMRYLDKLELEWNCTSTEHLPSNENILDNLVPPGGLKELVIESYSGKQLPRWLGASSSLPKLMFLRIRNCINCSSLPPLGQLPYLEVLVIEGLSELATLQADDGEFPSLHELQIISCPKFKSNISKPLPSLKKLMISKCSKELVDSSLITVNRAQCDVWIDDKKVQSRIEEATSHVSLSSTSHDEMQHYQHSPSKRVSDIEQLGQLSSDMQSLQIEGHETLESFPLEILRRKTSLLHLYVTDCGSLTSFLVDTHSTPLKTLHIKNCKKLNFPFTPNMFVNLEQLSIESSCDSLTSFLLDFFPNLRILCLSDCVNLISISIEEKLSQNGLNSLDVLEVRDCPNLESLLPDGLPAENLTSIFFSNCQKLQSLPEKMCDLKSLQSLFINECPKLKSLPTGGLPPSLNSLCITFCDNITLKNELELNQLVALTHFEIEGGCSEMESFPEKGLLPANLISLRISRLPDLKSLDQNELKQLSYLKKMEINCCKKLRSLPEELPSSLSSLSIKECPLLKAKLQNKQGIDWLRIAHIPSIFIDEEESY